jgi:hypothetical protein
MHSGSQKGRGRRITRALYVIISYFNNNFASTCILQAKAAQGVGALSVPQQCQERSRNRPVKEQKRPKHLSIPVRRCRLCGPGQKLTIAGGTSLGPLSKRCNTCMLHACCLATNRPRCRPIIRTTLPHGASFPPFLLAYLSAVSASAKTRCFPFFLVAASPLRGSGRRSPS